MSSKQFLILIGTGIFCALLFAAPGLHRLYKEMSSKPEPRGCLVECYPLTLVLGETKIEVEFTLLTTAESPPEQSRLYAKGSKRVYVVAELTNLTEKTVGLESLNLKLVQGKIVLVNETVGGGTGKPLVLNPKGNTKIQSVIYCSETICDWLAAKKLDVDSEAIPAALPQG
jgi:hypothetical protein